MNGNRLKINKDKTQFVWLGTPHQLSRIRCQKITFGGADIQISTEAMCLGVLLDNRLTFAPHIRRICCRCFYHLWQLRVVRKSLTVEAAKTMVHSFVVARCEYCNSVYYGASAIHIRPLQMCSTLQLDLLCVKESMTVSPLTSATFYMAARAATY